MEADLVDEALPSGQDAPPASPAEEQFTGKPAAVPMAETMGGAFPLSSPAEVEDDESVSTRSFMLGHPALSDLWLAEYVASTSRLTLVRVLTVASSRRLLPSTCDPAPSFEPRKRRRSPGPVRVVSGRSECSECVPSLSVLLQLRRRRLTARALYVRLTASSDTSPAESGRSGPAAFVAPDLPLSPPKPLDKKLPLIAVPVLLALLLVGGLAYFIVRRQNQIRASSSDGGLSASHGSSDTSAWSPPQSALERIRSLRYKFGAGPPPSVSDGGSSSRWTPLPPLPSGSGAGGRHRADDSGWASAHFARARSSSVVIHSTSQSVRDLPATPRSGRLRRDASAGDLSIHRQREFRRATQILSAFEHQVPNAVDPATPADGSPTDHDSGTEASDGNDGVPVSSYELICLPSSVFAFAGEPLIDPSPITPNFPPTSPPPSFSPVSTSSYGLHPLTPASSFGEHGWLETASLTAGDLPTPVSPRALVRPWNEGSIRLERSTSTATEDIALLIRPARPAATDADADVEAVVAVTPTGLTSASSPSSARTSVRNVLGLSIVVNGHRHGPIATAAGEESGSSTQSRSSGVRSSDVVC